MIASVVVLLSAAGLTVGTATTASADFRDCGSGYACAWDYTGFDGKYVAFAQYIPNFGLYGLSKTAASVYNNGNTCDARFYSGTSARGYSFLLKKGYTDSDLRNNIMSGSTSWLNQIDSGYFRC